MNKYLTEASLLGCLLDTLPEGQFVHDKAVAGLQIIESLVAKAGSLGDLLRAVPPSLSGLLQEAKS